MNTRKTRACLAAALLAAAPLAGAFLNALPRYAGVEELVNEKTGHYVLIANPAELDWVLQGGAGAGWRRTGYRLLHRIDVPYPEGVQVVDVCRFYSASASSHFYTAGSAECEALRQPGSGWSYEGRDFKAIVAVNGHCPAGAPVYRLYNNRWMFNDSNHRFTQDDRVRKRLVARGWTDEGVAFCSEPAMERSPEVHWHATADNLATLNLPPFQRTVEKGSPQVPPVINPEYPLSADNLTGWWPSWARLMTTSAYLDPDSVARSSFVQVLAAGFLPGMGVSSSLGLHLAGRDRTADVAAIGFRKPLDAPAAPWTVPRDSDVTLAVTLESVARVHRNGGHAYAFMALDLHDAGSNLPLRVTLQMLGTMPSSSFVGRDEDGRLIVSTPIGANAAFGDTRASHYKDCSQGCLPFAGYFEVRLGPEDMREIAARARQADPRFSADPASYSLRAFECRGETYLDGELGLTWQGCKMSMTY